MKKGIISLVVLVVLTLAGVSPAFAALEVGGDLYAGLHSMYLWRGFDLSKGDPVVQGGMDVSLSGITFSYWSNLDLDSGELNETDVTIDYSTDLGEKVSLSVGNIFYALEGLRDTNELYLGVTLNTLLSPSVTVYYDYDRAEETGIFCTASIGHDLELAEGLSFSLGALISYNLESDYAVGNYSALHNYELSLSGSYAISEQISIEPYLTYSDALSNDAESVIEDQLVGGASVSISF